MDRMSIKVVVAIFVALLVDGMCLQQIALSLPVLMNDFKIDIVLAGSLGTYSLVGMGFGGVFVGWLADRFGRVRVIKWSLVFFAVANSALACTQSYLQFAVASFITGVGISALYNIGTLVVAEYVPMNKRTTILGTVQAAWSIGYIIAALLSSAVLPVWGWRPMYLAPILFVLVVLVLLYDIKEPASFSVSAKSRNNGNPDVWANLFGNKQARKYFMLWSIALIMLQFGYYGANTWFPSYLVKEQGINLKEMGLFVAGTSCAMVLGKVLAGYLADKFGRKLMWCLTGLGTALILPIIMTFATPLSLPYLLPFFGLFYGAPFAILATYLSETFSTHIRGTAVSSVMAVAKIGAMFAPLFVGFVAKHYSIAFGMAFLGLAYAICSVIPALFIPEKLFDPRATVEQAYDECKPRVNN